MLKLLFLAGVVAMACGVAFSEDAKPQAKSLYEFTVKNIDGKDVSLSKYKGDVLLIVNVASL